MTNPADPYQGALFTPSGGLVWHWRALWRRRHWASFIKALDEDLQSWIPPKRQLLLLGPSAGWCLPTRFLTRFERIHAVDLDPLAAPLFRFNHGRALAASKTKLTFEIRHVFNELEALLNQYSEFAILFPNMLGQHVFHDSDAPRARATVEGLKTRLAGRHWASIHDRLSGGIPVGTALPDAFHISGPIENEALAKRLGLAGDWVDHQTAHVLPDDCARHLLCWPLLPDTVHVVEFGQVTPS